MAKAEDTLRRALEHTLGELGIPNICCSLVRGDFEELRKAHDSVHEFMLLAPLCLPSGGDASWYQKSAFLVYHYEAFHLAHRSYLEALAGYYNAAYILLRGFLELVLRGAFWECLAHRKYRERAERVEKVKFLREWIRDLAAQSPGLEEELERISAMIYGVIRPLHDHEEFRRKFVPGFREVAEQLAGWGILDPVPSEEVYGLYGELSRDVHAVPDATDIGRRILKRKDLLEISVIPEELNEFSRTLCRAVDVTIVVELNVMRDWIGQDEGVRARLAERLPVVRDLGLKHSLRWLEAVVSGSRGSTPSETS